MLLKTYRASSLAAALERARAELGSDALVLATTETQGRLGLEVVEVTVAAPRQEARPAPESNTRVDPAAPARPAAPSAPAEEEDARWAAARDALLASGLSQDLVARFARIAGEKSSAVRATDLAQATTRGVQRLIDFRDLPSASRCTFVVGPPGAGKTTTVAKLAARATESADRVFFAQADRDRIGAYEQAEIYSRYIGCVSARIDGSEDLDCVLAHAGPSGRIFVDTCGISRVNEERIDEIAELRRRVPRASVALLMPAGIHVEQANGILERFRSLSPDCVVLSRVDDGSRIGEVVSALATSGLPVAYFTNGPAVPHDLEPASPHSLAALLLRSGMTSRLKEPARCSQSR